jgi:hypothetical protein
VRWAGESSLVGHAAATVWCDEETEDPTRLLLDYVRFAVNDQNLPEEFIKALFVTKRLMVVVDRLSEKSAVTQHAWKTKFPAFVAMAIVTSRTEIEIALTRTDYLRLQPLNDANVSVLIDYLLENEAVHIERISNRAEFLQRLAGLITVGTTEINVTPLLVKLFVQAASRNWNNTAGEISWANMPSTIPQVFFDYVSRVNPTDIGAANYLSTAELYRAVRVLAVAELGDDFVPRGISSETALAVLRADGTVGSAIDRRGTDVLQRLLDNQILRSDEALGVVRVRFSLDPVAEYIAAMEHADGCGRNLVAWKELLEKVNAKVVLAAGFRGALQITYMTFRKAQGWPAEVENDFGKVSDLGI